MTSALDPDLESGFQLFGGIGSGFRYSKKRNRNTYRGVMILALEPDPESDFQPPNPDLDPVRSGIVTPLTLGSDSIVQV